jgi:porphobilinogen synthase
MPGVAQLSIDRLVAEAQARARARRAGGDPLRHPGAQGPARQSRLRPDGIVPRAVRALKAELPELLVWTDVCLCGATSHGHCGHVDAQGRVVNDETLPLLARAAVAYAQRAPTRSRRAT